ncbi:MAG: hypothetical protein PUP92_03575 [Rhizonema sp. PD38]|nr:hypothetical protein [Rhizonema sp. PD38]
MTEAIPQKPVRRRGRIFPERTLPPEELTKRLAGMNTIHRLL